MSSSRGNAGGSSSSSSSSSPTRPPRDSRPPPARSPSALPLPSASIAPPLHITIRFSVALPDLHLDISSPHQTTVVALKHLIRGRLAAEAEAAANRKNDVPAQPSPAAQASLAHLRFIHNGRILPDASVLSAVLKAPPPPPLSHHADPKGKAPAGVYPQQRVFINCSIGDVLPPSLLAEEAAAATAPPPSPHQPSTTTPSRTPLPRLQTTNLALAGDTHPRQSTTTTATRHGQQPRGFDRLLAAGFHPSEVSTLRTHFRAIHAARFTPDTLPSPDTLRAMEDAWLDNEQRLPTTTAISGSTSQLSYPSGAGGGGDDMQGGMGMDEDVYGLSAATGPLIKGMLIGFVFPLGVIGWLGKENGVWSGRMHGFVVLGVLLSVSVGLVRGLTGEG